MGEEGAGESGVERVRWIGGGLLEGDKGELSGAVWVRWKRGLVGEEREGGRDGEERERAGEGERGGEVEGD